jgi:hypothetical protein
MSAKRVQGAVIVIWSALAEVDFSEGYGGKELREDPVDEHTESQRWSRGRRPNLTNDGCPDQKKARECLKG